MLIALALITAAAEMPAPEVTLASLDPVIAKQGALYYARGLCARFDTPEQLTAVQLMVDSEEPAAQRFLRTKLAAGLQAGATMEQCLSASAQARAMALPTP